MIAYYDGVCYNINMKKINLTGQKFDRLLVIKESNIKKGGKTCWECLCDCGNYKIVVGTNLTLGKSKSCGCLHNELLTQRNITHNQRHTKIYEIWKTMKQRCNNPNLKNYKNYGGRGIKVCDEWINSFESFYEWSMQNGYSPELSIDRIDNNGNYCPENCRWTTRYNQSRNRRNNHYITFNNDTKIITDWAIFFNINPKNISSRISQGQDIQKYFQSLYDKMKSTK